LRALLQRLLEHLKDLDGQTKELEGQITLWHRDNELSRRLSAVPGIGPLTASALVATVGDAKNFSSGRQLAAWLGLVPRQESSGGKTVLLGISKRGDAYLRTLLIHGAPSVIYASGRKKASTNRWLAELIQRRNSNLAAVALANKTARIAWALLARGRLFQPSYQTAPPLNA
jgi:transposase